MIVKLFLTITIMFQVSQIRTNQLYSVLEIKDYFFQNANTNLHNVINKIFSYLKTMKYLGKTENNELLLQMHNDLMNVTDMNFKTNFFLKNVSFTNYTTGIYPSMFIDAINEVLRGLLRKNKDLNPLKYLHSINYTEESPQNDTDFNNSVDESTEFLIDFLKTFEKLTINNLTNFVYDINNHSKNMSHENIETTESAGVKVIFKSKTQELKVWNSSVLFTLPGNNTRRLYQGKPTKIKKYPFLVSVHIMNNFMCSGSIISKDLVVTAASCLQVAYSHKDNPRSVFVRVGSDYTKSFGQLIPVTEIHFHPDYDPRTLRNNIAAIRIMKNLKLSNEKGRIRRIEYDRSRKPQTDAVYVLGWGAQEPKHNPSNFQKLAIDLLNIYAFRDCKEIYSETYVTESNFCAGFANKGSGACNKDVGGPGFRDGILVGIISYGPPNCGMPNSPTVFTQLGYYAEWLDGLIRQKKVLRQGSPIENTIINKKAKEMPPTTTTMNPNILRQDPEYPDEVVILKEMLEEILTANKSIVGNIFRDDQTTNNNNNKKHHKINYDIRNFFNDNNKKKKPKYPKQSTEDRSEIKKPDFAFESTKADAIYSNESPDKDFEESNCNSGENISDNYETKYDEIAIDTNDPAFKNTSFLDVVLNIEQYQKPSKVNNNSRTGNKINTGIRDVIDIQFVIGTTQISPLTAKGDRKTQIQKFKKGTTKSSLDIEPRKLYYDDIEVGENVADFSLNFDSDKEPMVSQIKDMIGTIPKVKEVLYKSNNRDISIQ